MGGRFLRYLTLFTLFVKVGLMKQTAYRPHFILMITGKVVRMGLLFFFFQAVFLKVNQIGQWTYDHVLLLFATFQVIDYLMSITFQRNLSSSLPWRIRTGELDSRMVLPAHLLFFVSFEDIDMMDFFSFLPSLGFLTYVCYRMGFAFSLLQVILYTMLLVNALLFLYAILLIIATTSFWITQSYGLAMIFDNLMKIGRYPLDIFEGFWKIFFLYFLPLVLIAQMPSQALLNALSPESVLLSFAATGVFMVFALRFWRWGLTHYLSAST